jgi:predicted HTH transcriptional regulator
LIEKYGSGVRRAIETFIAIYKHTPVNEPVTLLKGLIYPYGLLNVGLRNLKKLKQLNFVALQKRAAIFKRLK